MVIKKDNQNDRYKKGKEAEFAFEKWLNKQKLIYWKVQQDKRYLYNTKRPDFIVFIPDIGLMLVEVKNRKLIHGNSAFPVDVKEFELFRRFRDLTGLQVWFVFSNNSFGFRTWFWVSLFSLVSKLKSLKIYKSNKSKDSFFSVPLSFFIQLGFSDHIKNLFFKLRN